MKGDFNNMKNNKLKENLFNEERGLEYVKVGDYYVPNLTLPKQEQVPLNKYGIMRLNYLKEYKYIDYITMLMNGTLNTHLKEVQEAIQNRVEQAINELKTQANLTEKAKAESQLYWVGTMNAIKQQAEEIAYKELLYV